jgi:FAD synthetase
MHKVLVFGTFDLLHPGHLAFLAAAAKHGAVTVVVTPDVKVKKEKGRAPHFSERERMQMVAALKSVSRAVIGDKGKKWTVVQRLAPDVICIGHDQHAAHPAFLAQLAKLKKHPKIVRLPAHKPARYSSSKMKLEIHRTTQKENRH